jgi:hypothetical protein
METTMKRGRITTPALAALIGAVLCFPFAAPAATYRAPGGPLPISRGGDNEAGYPPLSTVAVEEPAARAPAVRLALSCYPNPSRGTMSFRVFARPGVGVRVRLFAVNGRMVREWQRFGAGRSPVEWTWDGRDAHGRAVAAGLYFYRADAGSERVQGKLVVLGGGR